MVFPFQIIIQDGGKFHGQGEYPVGVNEGFTIPHPTGIADKGQEYYQRTFYDENA